jgi:ABC-2 type transport system permease protein
MNWKRIWAIARWEYLQKVRSKAFIASLLITPIIMIASFTLPQMLIDQEPDSTLAVGLVDSTGTLYTPLTDYFRTHDTLPKGIPSFTFLNYLRPGRTMADAIAEADSLSLNGLLEGVVVVHDSAGHTVASYRSANTGNIGLTSRIENAIETIVRQRKLAAAGIDTSLFNRLSETIDLTTVKINERGKGSSVGFGETYLTGYFLNFMLMLLVMTTGQSLVRSLVEEKSNRIMELLVSSSTPQELMWGKLIGLSGLGITQLMAWMLFGAAAGVYFAASSGFGAALSTVLPLLPYLMIYLILGYFFYAAIFIGVGSLVTTEQEAQAITSYLVLSLVTPIMIAIGVVQNPNAAYVRGLSFIPLLTPSMMIFRIVTKMPPLWEIIATMVVMVIGTAIVAWIASKIFRTAILLTGKRPNFAEVIRWLRAG